MAVHRHGLFQNAINDVLYGATTVRQEKSQDSCLQNLAGVSKLVRQIESGAFLTPRQMKVKRTSMSLRNSPRITDRIQNFFAPRASPIKSAISDEENRYDEPDHAFCEENAEETIGFDSSNAQTIIEKKSSPQKETRLPLSPKKVVANSGHKSDAKFIEKIGLMFEYRNSAAWIEDETPILRQLGHQTSGADLPVIDENMEESEDGTPKKLKWRAPTPFKRNSGLNIMASMESLAVNNDSIHSNHGQSSSIIDENVNAVDVVDTPKKPQWRAPTPAQKTGKLAGFKQNSGLSILARMESAASLQHEDQPSTPFEGHSISSSICPSSPIPIASSTLLTSSDDDDSSKKSGVPDFTYSKLARAQLHHQFRKFMKWEAKELASIATAVARIRFESICKIRQTPRNIIIVELFNFCNEKSNKEQQALCLALFALNDDVTMGSLTTHEEYVAEKRLRNLQQ